MLVFLAVAEIEILTFSPIIVKIAGRDAWLSQVLAALGTYGFLFLLVRLGQRFPHKTFFEYSPRLWGKPLTSLIILGYLGYWLTFAVRLLWRTADITTTFFLPNTPLLVVLFFFICGTIFLASYGLVPLVRFFEFMLLFYLVPYLLAIGIALSNMKISYFFPILADGIWPVIKGALLMMATLNGLEILLFAIPLTARPQQTLLPAFAGLSLFHLTVVAQTLAIIGNLGAVTIREMVYPSMDMLSTLRLPGWPVERFELFLTLPWLIGAFTSVALCIYLLCNGILKILPLKNPKPVYWTIGSGAVILTYLISNILWVFLLEKYLWAITPVFIYLIPLASYLLALIRRQREEDRA